MLIRQEQLSAQLEQGIHPVYFIGTDDPMLMQESADKIRAAVLAAGYTDRQVLHVEERFDWSVLQQAGSALSLFNDKRLVELRLNSLKVGKAGSEALQQCLKQANPSISILIQGPWPDRSAKNSAWYKAIDAVGLILALWPLNAQQTEQWVGDKLRKAGLIASQEVVRYIALRVEGNLLAAKQEIDQLSLMFPQGELTLDQVQELISNQARYSPFELVDEILGNNKERIRHVVEVLQAEGEPVPVIIWVMSDLLRQMEFSWAGRQGSKAPWQGAPIPRPRQQKIQKAITAMRSPNWAGLYQRIAGLDQRAKGVAEDGITSQQKLWDDIFDCALHLSRGS